MNQDDFHKLTYSPGEFAALFGKERTWGYRQLYAGKVQAVTEYGRTMIPKSEVDRVLGEAGRYLGAKAKPKKHSTETAKKGSGNLPESKGNDWSMAIKRRKKPSSQPRESAHSADDRKPSSPKRPRPCDQATSRQSVYQRLTRYKSSQKGGEDRGG